MSKVKTLRPDPPQSVRPKGELAVIPKQEEYCTYVQIFILKADGVLTSFNQRANKDRNTKGLELPNNAIAYRFFDALSIFSSGRRGSNWRGRGMNTAHNHSPVFGTDHQKICDSLTDMALAKVVDAKREQFRAEGLLK